MSDFLKAVNPGSWPAEVESLVRIVVVLAVVYAALKVMSRVLEPALHRMIDSQMVGQPQVEVDKRVGTLNQVIYRTAWIAAIPLVLMTVLPELGINTGALLASTSILALAVGFGAQSLVKDVIAGGFILVENQYARGDVVNIAGVGGVVEDVNLRRTVLRDLDGAIHSVPNGNVEVASNLTRTWSRANMLVSVAYREDMERVFGVINDVGKQMADDPEWSREIIEPPSALGIEEFGDSGVQIRILGVTQPIKQWDVMRELRRRLKYAFDREGIEIPFPHRTLVTAGQKVANAR